MAKEDLKYVNYIKIHIALRWAYKNSFYTNGYCRAAKEKKGTVELMALMDHEYEEFASFMVGHQYIDHLPPLLQGDRGTPGQQGVSGSLGRPGPPGRRGTPGPGGDQGPKVSLSSPWTICIAHYVPKSHSNIHCMYLNRGMLDLQEVSEPEEAMETL